MRSSAARTQVSEKIISAICFSYVCIMKFYVRLSNTYGYLNWCQTRWHFIAYFYIICIIYMGKILSNIIIRTCRATGWIYIQIFKLVSNKVTLYCLSFSILYVYSIYYMGKILSNIIWTCRATGWICFLYAVVQGNVYCETLKKRKATCLSLYCSEMKLKLKMCNM